MKTSMENLENSCGKRMYPVHTAWRNQNKNQGNTTFCISWRRCNSLSWFADISRCFRRILFLREDCILKQLPCWLLLQLLPSTGIAMVVVELPALNLEYLWNFDGFSARFSHSKTVSNPACSIQLPTASWANLQISAVSRKHQKTLSSNFFCNFSGWSYL